MKWMVLRFFDAELRNSYVTKPPKGSKKLGRSSLDPEFFNNSDWISPIGVNQVSNMLHSMFNLIPVPTYKKTNLKRNEYIYNMALHSYIKYDGWKPSDRKIPIKEYCVEKKARFNSDSKTVTVFDGHKVKGHYSWDYFERRFKNGNEHLLYEILTLFNKTLGVSDVRREYTFPEFVVEFKKHLDEEDVVRFKEERLCYGGDFYGVNKPLSKAYMTLLTEREWPEKGGLSNCSYNSRTPILITNGVGCKVSWSGEIIVPIEEKDIEYLSQYGSLPTILDGGLISLVKFRKKLDWNDIEKNFISFFEHENGRKCCDSEEVK